MAIGGGKKVIGANAPQDIAIEYEYARHILIERISALSDKYKNSPRPLSEYIADRAGFRDADEVEEVLSVEQIYSVAMAIYNIEHRDIGSLIADEMGVGKGRQLASLIKYAVNNGMKPIFFTERPELFSDIYRDLIDINAVSGVPIYKRTMNVDGGKIGAAGEHDLEGDSTESLPEIVDWEGNNEDEADEGTDVEDETYNELEGEQEEDRAIKEALRATFILNRSYKFPEIKPFVFVAPSNTKSKKFREHFYRGNIKSMPKEIDGSDLTSADIFTVEGSVLWLSHNKKELESIYNRIYRIYKEKWVNGGQLRAKAIEEFRNIVKDYDVILVPYSLLKKDYKSPQTVALSVFLGVVGDLFLLDEAHTAAGGVSSTNISNVFINIIRAIHQAQMLRNPAAKELKDKVKGAVVFSSATHAKAISVLRLYSPFLNLEHILFPLFTINEQKGSLSVIKNYEAEIVENDIFRHKGMVLKKDLMKMLVADGIAVRRSVATQGETQIINPKDSADLEFTEREKLYKLYIDAIAQANLNILKELSGVPVKDIIGRTSESDEPQQGQLPEIVDWDSDNHNDNEQEGGLDENENQQYSQKMDTEESDEEGFTGIDLLSSISSLIATDSLMTPILNIAHVALPDDFSMYNLPEVATYKRAIQDLEGVIGDNLIAKDTYQLEQSIDTSALKYSYNFRKWVVNNIGVEITSDTHIVHMFSVKDLDFAKRIIKPEPLSFNISSLYDVKQYIYDNIYRDREYKYSTLLPVVHNYIISNDNPIRLKLEQNNYYHTKFIGGISCLPPIPKHDDYIAVPSGLLGFATYSKAFLSLWLTANFTRKKAKLPLTHLAYTSLTSLYQVGIIADLIINMLTSYVVTLKALKSSGAASNRQSNGSGDVLDAFTDKCANIVRDIIAEAVAVNLFVLKDNMLLNAYKWWGDIVSSSAVSNLKDDILDLFKEIVSQEIALNIDNIDDSKWGDWDVEQDKQLTLRILELIVERLFKHLDIGVEGVYKDSILDNIIQSVRNNYNYLQGIGDLVKEINDLSSGIQEDIIPLLIYLFIKETLGKTLKANEIKKINNLIKSERESLKNNHKLKELLKAHEDLFTMIYNKPNIALDSFTFAYKTAVKGISYDRIKSLYSGKLSNLIGDFALLIAKMHIIVSNYDKMSNKLPDLVDYIISDINERKLLVLKSIHKASTEVYDTDKREGEKKKLPKEARLLLPKSLTIGWQWRYSLISEIMENAKYIENAMLKVPIAIKHIQKNITKFNTVVSISKTGGAIIKRLMDAGIKHGVGDDLSKFEQQIISAIISSANSASEDNTTYTNSISRLLALLSIIRDSDAWKDDNIFSIDERIEKVAEALREEIDSIRGREKELDASVWGFFKYLSSGAFDVNMRFGFFRWNSGIPIGKDPALLTSNTKLVIATSTTGISLSKNFIGELYLMIDKYKKIGISVIDEINNVFGGDELTGRQYRLSYKPQEPYRAFVEPRTRSTKDIVLEFNTNRLPVVCITSAGSTGISLHSFVVRDNEGNEIIPEDKVKRRMMVIIEPEDDINKEVQKRGRINRTGQIYKPLYSYILSGTVADNRKIVSMLYKMSSLYALSGSSLKTVALIREEDNILTKYAGISFVYALIYKNIEELSNVISNNFDEIERRAKMLIDGIKKDYEGDIWQYVSDISVDYLLFSKILSKEGYSYNDVKKYKSIIDYVVASSLKSIAPINRALGQLKFVKHGLVFNDSLYIGIMNRLVSYASLLPSHIQEAMFEIIKEFNSYILNIARINNTLESYEQVKELDLAELDVANEIYSKTGIVRQTQHLSIIPISSPFDSPSPLPIKGDTSRTPVLSIPPITGNMVGSPFTSIISPELAVKQIKTYALPIENAVLSLEGIDFVVANRNLIHEFYKDIVEKTIREYINSNCEYGFSQISNEMKYKFPYYNQYNQMAIDISVKDLSSQILRNRQPSTRLSILRGIPFTSAESDIRSLQLYFSVFLMDGLFDSKAENKLKIEFNELANKGEITIDREKFFRGLETEIKSKINNLFEKIASDVFIQKAIHNIKDKLELLINTYITKSKTSVYSAQINLKTINTSALSSNKLSTVNKMEIIASSLLELQGLYNDKMAYKDGLIDILNGVEKQFANLVSAFVLNLLGIVMNLEALKLSVLNDVIKPMLNHKNKQYAELLSKVLDNEQIEKGLGYFLERYAKLIISEILPQFNITSIVAGNIKRAISTSINTAARNAGLGKTLYRFFDVAKLSFIGTPLFPIMKEFIYESIKNLLDEYMHAISNNTAQTGQSSLVKVSNIEVVAERISAVILDGVVLPRSFSYSSLNPFYWQAEATYYSLDTKHNKSNAQVTIKLKQPELLSKTIFNYLFAVRNTINSFIDDAKIVKPYPTYNGYKDLSDIIDDIITILLAHYLINAISIYIDKHSTLINQIGKGQDISNEVISDVVIPIRSLITMLIATLFDFQIQVQTNEQQRNKTKSNITISAIIKGGCFIEQITGAKRFEIYENIKSLLRSITNNEYNNLKGKDTSHNLFNDLIIAISQSAQKGEWDKTYDLLSAISDIVEEAKRLTEDSISYVQGQVVDNVITLINMIYELLDDLQKEDTIGKILANVYNNAE